MTPDHELDLHFAALSVLWLNHRELSSYAWFRAVFAEHLANVNCFTEHQVAEAIEHLDAGRIALPSPLPFLLPVSSCRTQQRVDGAMQLLDSTVQVAVALARRSAPDVKEAVELWPLVERNLGGLRAPEGVIRYARRALRERGIQAFTAEPLDTVVDLEMIALTVLSATSPRIGSALEFREAFAQHLTVVCRFSFDRVTRALDAYDAGELDLPPFAVVSPPE